MNSNDYEYDIALSFAGEERWYVEVVAKELNNNNIKVFYDEYERTDLWGKFLPDHLYEVYSVKALYCIIFISENYANKAWTNHERKSAVSRAVRQKEQYILPARFDGTEIIGFESISYIDLQDYSPYEFAEVVINKLKKSIENNLATRLKSYIPKSKRFNYKLEYEEMAVLKRFGHSQFRYRAINKIAKELVVDKEVVRKKLLFLNQKGLVDTVHRQNGPKWVITIDGREYLDYYHHMFDESSS